MKRMPILLTLWILACVPGAVASDDALPPQIASCFAPPSELADDFEDYASPLVFYDDRRVKTSDDWQRRRKEISSIWRTIRSWTET